MSLLKITAPSLKLPKGINLYRKIYGDQPIPEGVKIVKTTVHPDDHGGWFKETLRLNDLGEVISLKQLGISFKVRQSMISLANPGTKRFWHICPNKKLRPGQNQFWTTNGTVLLGLVDLRKDSKTYGLKSKIILAPDYGVYVPAGIAQGFINPNNSTASIVYYVDQHFTADEHTQEHVIKPEDLPFDFVESELV